MQSNCHKIQLSFTVALFQIKHILCLHNKQLSIIFLINRPFFVLFPSDTLSTSFLQVFFFLNTNNHLSATHNKSSYFNFWNILINTKREQKANKRNSNIQINPPYKVQVSILPRTVSFQSQHALFPHLPSNKISAPEPQGLAVFVKSSHGPK